MDPAVASTSEATSWSDSLFIAALERLAHVRDTGSRRVLTDPFLDVCRLVLPVIDKLGTAFALVRSDIGGNIERLDTRYQTDPNKFSSLFMIVEDEVARQDHIHSKSCTKGLLWLKRAMEFTVAILQRLHDDATSSLSTIVSETYYATLNKFHGFFASSAFSVAFKFVPSREYFLEQVAGQSTSVMQDMKQFGTAYSSVLEDVHKFLVSVFPLSY
eukprot:jgi/Chrzof1/10997/Cz05g19300.t1